MLEMIRTPCDEGDFDQQCGRQYAEDTLNKEFVGRERAIRDNEAEGLKK
jgi:hypothetical protein